VVCYLFVSNWTRRVGIDEIPARRVHVDPAAVIAEVSTVAVISSERANRDHLREGGRPARLAGAVVAGGDSAYDTFVLAKEPEPAFEAKQVEFFPRRCSD